MQIAREFKKKILIANFFYLSWEHNKGSEYHGKHIKLADPDVWVYVTITNGGESDHGEPQGLKQVKLSVTPTLEVLHPTHTNGRTKTKIILLTYQNPNTY